MREITHSRHNLARLHDFTRQNADGDERAIEGRSQGALIKFRAGRLQLRLRLQDPGMSSGALLWRPSDPNELEAVPLAPALTLDELVLLCGFQPLFSRFHAQIQRGHVQQNQRLSGLDRVTRLDQNLFYRRRDQKAEVG